VSHEGDDESDTERWLVQVRLVMLTRVPVLGKVKSRLARRIGAPQALIAHARLLERNAALAAASGMRFELHFEGDPNQPYFAGLAAELGARLVAQRRGDICQRMLAAAQYEKAPSVLIGSDCGGFNRSYLRDAALLLRRHSAVLGPAEDGGYVLIAQSEPQPMLFANIPWGTAEVAARTRASAQLNAIDLAELPLQWDVDGVSDWRRYCRVNR